MEVNRQVRAQHLQVQQLRRQLALPGRTFDGPPTGGGRRRSANQRDGVKDSRGNASSSGSGSKWASYASCSGSFGRRSIRPNVPGEDVPGANRRKARSNSNGSSSSSSNDSRDSSDSNESNRKGGNGDGSSSGSGRSSGSRSKCRAREPKRKQQQELSVTRNEGGLNDCERGQKRERDAGNGHDTYNNKGNDNDNDDGAGNGNDKDSVNHRDPSCGPPPRKRRRLDGSPP